MARYLQKPVLLPKAGSLFQRLDARPFQTNTHRLIDVCAVTPFVRRQGHHRIMDRGINCQRAIKRLTTHSHHRSKESLLSALGSTGFGAADLAFGATGLAEFFGAKGLAEFSGATGLAGFSTNRLKQISLSSSSFKKRQSLTTSAGPGFGLVRGRRIAS